MIDDNDNDNHNNNNHNNNNTNTTRTTTILNIGMQTIRLGILLGLQYWVKPHSDYHFRFVSGGTTFHTAASSEISAA
jgi:hypothetical protein